MALRVAWDFAEENAEERECEGRAGEIYEKIPVLPKTIQGVLRRLLRSR
jgi:hypothetical protein